MYGSFNGLMDEFLEHCKVKNSKSVTFRLEMCLRNAFRVELPTICLLPVSVWSHTHT